MQSNSSCNRVRSANGALVNACCNQLTKLSELKSFLLVVTVCCTSERSSELNII